MENPYKMFGHVLYKQIIDRDDGQVDGTDNCC